MLAVFQVGDRVRCIAEFDGMSEAVDKAGTVRDVNNNGVGVEFDEYISGHDLSGICRSGHGWWFNADCANEHLEPYYDETDTPIEPDEDAWNEFIGTFIMEG